VAVYFVQANQNGPVKIGTAEDVIGRLRELQTAHYMVLRLLREIDGDYRLERALHRRFTAQHIRGEWFAFHPDMLTIMPVDVEIAATVPVDLTEYQAGFLQEINEFIGRSGMSSTALGRKAVGDGGFVAGVRNGRDLRLSTIKRVREFIAQQASHSPRASG
jgi:hypothetical protein